MFSIFISYIISLSLPKVGCGVISGLGVGIYPHITLKDLTRHLAQCRGVRLATKGAKFLSRRLGFHLLKQKSGNFFQDLTSGLRSNQPKPLVKTFLFELREFFDKYDFPCFSERIRIFSFLSFSHFCVIPKIPKH